MVDVQQRRDNGNEVTGARTPVLGVFTPPDTTVTVQQIADGPFGCIVRGLQWDAVSDGDVEVLTLALRLHLLMVLRGQRSPTENELDAFLRRFGRLVLETDDGQAHYAGHLNQGDRPASEVA